MPQALDMPDAGWRRHFLLLMALNTCNQMQNSGARLAVVLFAVHQQASPMVVGILIGLNSLVPALSSVSLGRMLDRMRDMRSAFLVSSLISSVIMLLPFFWESIAALFICTVVTGSAFNVFRIGGMQATGRYGRPEDRPRNYNMYSQTLSAANLLAPLLAGFAIDHLGFRQVFLVLFLLALPSIVVFLMRSIQLPAAEVVKPRDKVEGGHGGLWSLLRMNQLRQVMITGVTLFAVSDMFSFAWPQYGAKLQFPASQIGLVVSIFYSGAFIVRTAATYLLRRFSQWQLLLLAMLISSVLFLAFPISSNIVVVCIMAFMLGLVLGISQPMTMSLVYDEAPEDRKGEVIGLRVTLAFATHVAVPLVAGALATNLGLGVIWYLCAGMLLVGGWMTRKQWSHRNAPAK